MGALAILGQMIQVTYRFIKDRYEQRKVQNWIDSLSSSRLGSRTDRGLILRRSATESSDLDDEDDSGGVGLLEPPAPVTEVEELVGVVEEEATSVAEEPVPTSEVSPKPAWNIITDSKKKTDSDSELPPHRLAGLHRGGGASTG